MMPHEFEESLNWWDDLHGNCAVCGLPADAEIHADTDGCFVRVCLICDHKGCGWCPECHPEVPDL